MESTCLWCGAAYTKRPGRGGGRRRYCSQRCRDAVGNAPRRSTHEREQAECVVCKGPFSRPATCKHYKYCSAACRTESGLGPPVRTHECAVCGGLFTRLRQNGGQPPRACPDCRTTRGKGYRRHLRSVLSRDGHECQLCGLPIDVRCRAPHPGTASLDHIVPGALGGTDDPENLRAAHVHCNRRRGIGEWDSSMAPDPSMIAFSAPTVTVVEARIIELVLHSSLSFLEITAETGFKDVGVVRRVLNKHNVKISGQQRRRAIERAA